MVKKTLLSLAIAATAAGLAGCNVSTTDKYDNKITSNPPAAAEMPVATSATYPIFDPTNSKVPLGIDFLFGINSQLEEGEPGKDGTANTADTTPPVTTAMNKLDGFSTVAPIYIDFNNELNPASVIGGATVILLEMLNPEDDPSIDSLDLASIAAAGSGNPIKGAVDPADYEVNLITYTGADDPAQAIQILPKKPLNPKTKYMVVITENVVDTNMDPIGKSSDYALLLGNQVLPSRSLDGARKLVQTWNGIATAALGGAATPAFSYTFTTGSPQDVLKAMAAPTLAVASVVPDIATAEGAVLQAKGADVGADTLDAIANGVATQLNAANAGNPGWADLPTTGSDARTALKATAELAPYYFKALIENAIAPSQNINLADLASAVDAPASRTYKTLATTQGAVAVDYDDLLTALVTPKVEALIVSTTGAQTPTDLQKIVAAEGILTAASVPSVVIDGIALQTAEAINLAAGSTVVSEANDGADARTFFKDPAGASVAGNYVTALTKAIVSGQVSDMSSGGTVYQGGIKLPSYLPEATAGTPDAALGNWSGSDAVAQELGLEGAPRDRNGSINVTYRFPFANKLGDNVIPVFATLPADSCDPDGSGPAPAITKPANGWPVAIYQHGFTVDRTAGVLVGNALAKSCVAMVAIDHAMHGVAPGSSTGITFNVEQVSSGYDSAVPETAALSPFALARAGAAAQGDEFFAALKERHNNVGKDALSNNVAMAFKAAGADADVGASGDLYINLSDFARTRDGMRQTVVDLMNLNASIGDMDINGDNVADDLDPAKVYFVGHSLGGIVGTTFVAVNNDPSVQLFNGNLPKIQAAILGNPGGGVVKLLENSPSIGAAKILPGLAYASKGALVQGSASLEKFFGVFQAMVDSADPINFAGSAHMQTLPTLVYTAVEDLVVPNNTTAPAEATAKSYLSGTEPLVAQLGITTVINGSTTENDPLNSADFTAGSRFSVRTDSEKSTHSTFSSADPADTFTEIFTQIGSFVQYGLTGIKVTNSDVLEQPAP